MRLQGKRALVSGAVSGIGKAMAIRFAMEGASVVIADIDHHAATDATGSILASGSEAEFVEVDITDQGAVLESDWPNEWLLQPHLIKHRINLGIPSGLG